MLKVFSVELLFHARLLSLDSLYLFSIKAYLVCTTAKKLLFVDRIYLVILAMDDETYLVALIITVFPRLRCFKGQPLSNVSGVYLVLDEVS